ncbi:nitric oxide-associated protein 1 [Diaphorina citri]|uniref:Nitric oxide-associated protein 1 n=1 Tax=Diaphorina citri TaxID=121845 RepID=A0A1S3D118_DIACI|nr:nitric oxide-associated protein 1 [Diaphorina citri]
MRWMRDYEVYDESEEDDFDIDPSYFEYGTPDPSIPASTVPCGGCGAHLHCQDPSIPGYLPREIFSPCSKPDLKAIVCQRCHLMKNYNMALNVNVKPEDYEKLLQPIRRMKALVILIVDMTDFPCSIWPGILNVIGVKRPIFVVGNKIDAIPGDSKGWLKQAEQALRDALPTQANVLDVSFISAKTGYGIEELITKIYKIWELRETYKFPIFKPTPHELQVRNVRLHERAKIDKQEKYLYEEQKRAFKWKDTGVKSLVGHIGRTFGAENTGDREAELSMSKVDPKRLVSRDVFNEKDNLFAHGKWCYDTPGTVQPDQIIHLLTTEELVATLPKSVIRPRVLHLRPGQTLFIAGLGRLDFVESTNDLSIR